MSFGYFIKSVLLINLIITYSCYGTPLRRLTTWDCGSEDRKIIFRDARINPSPIVYPGNVSMIAEVELLEDLPTENLMVKISLSKLEPQRMIVPCFNGLGSCTYDVCQKVIPENQAAFCAFGACNCPLTRQTYRAASIPYMLPSIGGPIFAKILEGNYDGNITFFNNVTNEVYGCMGMQMPIRARDDV